MAKNEQEKLQEYYQKLPSTCVDYLFETGTEKATSSRLAYARELYKFFEFLTETDDRFIVPIKQIQLSDIKKIESSDISIYLTINKDRGLKERSLARMRSSLSDFFEYLTKKKIIDHNPRATRLNTLIWTSN